MEHYQVTVGKDRKVERKIALEAEKKFTKDKITIWEKRLYRVWNDFLSTFKLLLSFDTAAGYTKSKVTFGVC